MNARLLFFLSISLLFFEAALADGVYQRTKDRNTFVWNPDFQPDDGATWSGPRDKEHYATGDGTLTWYRIKRTHGVGARVPEQYIPLMQYSGKMVHGKLEGLVVSVDDKGQTFHATFVDGARTDEWVSGPAPNPPGTPKASPNESIRSAKRAETTHPPSEETEASPAPKKVGGATATNKAAEKRSKNTVEEDAFTPPPDNIKVPVSSPKTDYDRVVERGIGRKAAEKPIPAEVEPAQPSASVGVSAAKTTPTPSATSEPTLRAEESTPGVATSPSERTIYSGRALGGGSSDPGDALRSLSLPPQSLRAAARNGGNPRSSLSPAPSPSQSSSTAAPGPTNIAEPKNAQPSPTSNP